MLIQINTKFINEKGSQPIKHRPLGIEIIGDPYGLYLLEKINSFLGLNIYHN